jgi:hypothetical protein
MIDFPIYLESLAAKSKFINHSSNSKAFFKASHPALLDEIIHNMGASFQKAVIAFTNQEGRFEYNHSDNIIDRNHYSFAIIGRSKIADYNDAEKIKEECRLIGKKFMAHLRKDAKLEAKGETGIGLRYIDWGSVHHMAIGPIADNCYGVHWSFTIQESVELSYNSEDWNE